MMRIDESVSVITNYVKEVGLPLESQSFTVLSEFHVGAVLTDAILQAGLNYQSVVLPRVARIQQNFPEASTVSGFLSVIECVGVYKLLSWEHPEKPNRLIELSTFLLESNVDSDRELREWLCINQNAESLLNVHGIGPKTVDYLKTLCGIETIAVDRHVRTFAGEAGVDAKSYGELQAILLAVAEKMQTPASTLDSAIWTHISRRDRLRGNYIAQ